MSPDLMTAFSTLSFVPRLLSCAQLFATREPVACQAPLSVKFPRQEYWSELPLPIPGELPEPRTEPGCPALQADSLPLSPLGSPWM